MKMQALQRLGLHSIFFCLMSITTHHHRFAWTLICFVTGLTHPMTTHCAPYELRVYADDTPKKGESELEVIVSVAKPKSTSDGPNGQVIQTLIEYGYGLSQGWSIGLELPMSRTAGQSKLDGLKAEMQYIAEHNAHHGWYWGLRGDVGYTSSPYERQGGNSIGINPIAGYRWSAWHMVVNPSIEIPLSGTGSQPQFQPSAKIAHAITETRQLGLEYFSSWGALSSIRPQRQRDESIYLVWDERLLASRWNMGIGKPLNPSGGSIDKWIVKVGVNLDLD